MKGQETIILLTHISRNFWTEESPAIFVPVKDPDCCPPASPARASNKQDLPWADQAASHSQPLDINWYGLHTESYGAP